MNHKENSVYSLTGMVIGIILGVVIANQSTVLRPEAPIQEASNPQAQQQTNQDALPPGHPTIDETALRKQLEEQKQILQSDPENQQVLVTVANINSDLKEYAQAISYYEKALLKDSNNVNLITDLGTAYFYSKDHQKALNLYNRSLAVDPKHFQTLMNIGIVKMSTGDKPGAAEAWEKFVAYYPETQEATQLKGMIAQLKEKS